MLSNFRKINSMINPKDGSELLYVQEGYFFMGNSKEIVDIVMQKMGVPQNEIHNFYDETPQRKIFLNSYWISKYAITNGQFAKFIEDTNYLSHLSDYEKGSDLKYEFMGGRMLNREPINEYKRILNNISGKDYPVSGITFFEARAYAKWAECDLPSEAQWEKAARGNDRRHFPWGNDVNLKKLNCLETSYPMPDGIKVTEKSEYSSPYGCVQMSGNVGEWCLDYYDPKHYEIMPEDNPCDMRGGQHMVVRGGGTIKPMVFARTSARDIAVPNARGDFLGFRIVKNLNKK